jgi:hypothetical protein
MRARGRSRRHPPPPDAVGVRSRHFSRIRLAPLASLRSDLLPAWARAPHDVMIVRLKRTDYVAIMALSVTALMDMLTSSDQRWGAERPAARAAAYFTSAHLAIATKWVVTQARQRPFARRTCMPHAGGA